MTAPHVLIPPAPESPLRSALITSIDVEADAAQALELWAYQLQMNPAKGAQRASDDMLALAERLTKSLEASRKALAESEGAL